jgi:hypothetical protein
MNQKTRKYFSALKEFFDRSQFFCRGLAVPASHMLRIPPDVPTREAIL